MTKSKQRILCQGCDNRAKTGSYCNKLSTNHMQGLIDNCPKNPDNWNMTAHEQLSLEVLKVRFDIKLEMRESR